jgi:chromosome partitioning protein
MRARVVIFSNQKGGVGKTTLTRELGIYVASRGKRLLFIDCDPQGNLTRSLLEESDGGLYQALMEGAFDLVEIQKGLSILCGDWKLSLLEKSLLGEIDAYSRIRALLTQERFQEFDFIFLDTPPSLGVLTVNALAAAEHLVIPMNPSLYSMQGTNDLMRIIAKVKENLNPALGLLGVIVNAYDSVPVITRQIRGEIQEAFGEKVFATVLSKSIRIEEAIALKKGVIQHGKLGASRAADEVMKLGEELLRRIGDDGGGAP